MYIHLTTHSWFSLQEGLSTPTELVQAAQANGMSALGLTDHNILTGVIEFVKACKAVDIQPILGLEIDLNHGPVSLFATSFEGWSCLCRLSSSIHLRDNSNAPCTLDMLASCSKGLIAISIKYMVRPSAVKEGSDSLNWVLMLDPKFMATFCELSADWAVIATGALDFALRNASPNIRKGRSASSNTTPVTNLRGRDRVPCLQVLTTHMPAGMLNTNRDKSPQPKPME